MAKVRAWFEASGLSLHDLGLKMGYPAETARQSAWQFMKSSDPRISMLRRFAQAAGLPIEELTGGQQGQNTGTKEDATVTLYLKEHSLTKGELGRFKAALDSHGATLAAFDHPDGRRIRLIALPGEDMLRVTTTAAKAADVEHACRHSGFEVSRQPPPKSGQPRVEMYPR
jgi:transcriptional regulator with XRE-family HTH domain